MLENIMLSFRGIRSHRMRSVLTMLGIIIGIASIIIIVSIIGGASAQLKDSMVGGDANTITVSLYEKDSLFMSMEYDPSQNGPISGVDKVSEEELDKIRQIPGVSGASAIYQHEYGSNEIKYLDKNAYAMVCGVNIDYFNIYGRVLTSGRLFTQRDFDNRSNVVILEDFAATTLFKNESALGKTVQIGNELFTVVGVVTRLTDYSEIENISDYFSKVGFVNASVFIPTTSWNDAVGYDDIQSVVLQIDDPDQLVAASTLAAGILNDGLPTNDYEFKSGSLTEDSEYLGEITSVASILLIGIASISLIVGGIGVMNIMLVSVTERTREIGLKKALGARRRVILGQFLTESVVLTSLGGVIGVLIGIGIAKLVGLIIQMPAVISISSIIISVAFSMGVGIIFGLVPSIKAANLNPIDALRYE